MAKEKKERKRQLTDKQKAFVAAYLKCWNATEAAKAANYKGNRVTLGSVGWENLQKPQVKAAIKQLTAENAMGLAEALARIADIGRGTLSDFVKISQAGEVEADIKKARNRKKLHLLKVLTFSGDKIQRIEILDQLKALEILARAGGAFDEAVHVHLPPFDLDKWKAKADKTLGKVQDMPDPYEDAGLDEG